MPGSRAQSRLRGLRDGPRISVADAGALSAQGEETLGGRAGNAGSHRVADQPVNEPTSTLGGVLREMRRAKGYTLRGFAQAVGISPAYMSVIEQNKTGRPPPTARLRSMARALGESPDRLLAMSGRLSEDVAEIVSREPEATLALLRAAKGLSAKELDRVTESIERKRTKANRRGARAVRAVMRSGAGRRANRTGKSGRRAGAPSAARRPSRRSATSR